MLVPNKKRFEHDCEDPRIQHEMIKSVPLRWGLGFLWALRGQCCVGGICDSKIKEIWWFTTKVCPTLRVPIGVRNSPRGITIHIYKFCLFGTPRPNHNKPNAMIKKLNEHRFETKGTTQKTQQIHPAAPQYTCIRCVFRPPRPNHNKPN